VMLKKQYAVGKKLGEGAFSVVKLAAHRVTGKRVAVKCCCKKDMPPADRDNLDNEIKIMKSLNHPYIVQFMDAFDDNTSTYVVLEYMAGGELFERIVTKVKYTEDVARDCVRVICTGIKYLHDNDVVHRDIKPENLLLVSKSDDTSLKIADFGLAAVASQPTLSTPCGTPSYAAPEILNSCPYGKAVDMWALGVVSYCLLGGYLPFDEEDIGDLFSSIKRGEYEFDEEHWGAVSTEAKNFISSLLRVNPKQRMTAHEALDHPWLHVDPMILSARDLTGNLDELRAYQARMKFKVTARAVMAAQKFKRKLVKPRQRRQSMFNCGEFSDLSYQEQEKYHPKQESPTHVFPISPEKVIRNVNRNTQIGQNYVITDSALSPEMLPPVLHQKTSIESVGASFNTASSKCNRQTSSGTREVVESVAASLSLDHRINNRGGRLKERAEGKCTTPLQRASLDNTPCKRADNDGNARRKSISGEDSMDQHVVRISPRPPSLYKPQSPVLLPKISDTGRTIRQGQDHTRKSLYHRL